MCAYDFATSSRVRVHYRHVHRRAAVVLALLIGCHDSPPSQGGDDDDTSAPPSPTVPGLGSAEFGAGDLDAASHGGTITFQNIGMPGWYPSRRDPDVGPCDAYQTDSCCLAHHDVAGDQLTPWDRDLILTLRGPMHVKQLATYQPDPDAAGAWHLVSAWDDRKPSGPMGIAFNKAGFAGNIGTECLVDVSTDQAFACGPGSEPFCPASSDPKYYGWSGTKLVIVLAKMAHADEVGDACSTGTTGNWYDAPWVGLSLGELNRAGSFSSCQCYAKDPSKWYLGDGCGQFNVFEVVNDNNSSKNLGVFSTNFFGYAGYVGEGPCGAACDTSSLAPEVDLIAKANDTEAAAGAVASPGTGPRAAFRRPLDGYRYFAILMHVETRTVQLAIIHPSAIPASVAPLLPALPSQVDGAAVDALEQLRLPH